MEKTFYLQTYNYKYNAWLPVEIIGKYDDKVIKIRTYIFVTEKQPDGTYAKVFKGTLDTGAFWTHIQEIKDENARVYTI